jgi:hypothetical protein
MHCRPATFVGGRYQGMVPQSTFRQRIRWHGLAETRFELEPVLARAG